MRWDPGIITGFAVLDSCGKRYLAHAVLERGGHKDGWDADLTPAAESFLCSLATRLAEVFWDDDRHVDVPSRARQEAKEALYEVDRLNAPGILYAIAPWSRLPPGTIGDLHRACRPKLAEALLPFIGRILRSWCDDELLIDVSRRAG